MGVLVKFQKHKAYSCCDEVGKFFNKVICQCSLWNPMISFTVNTFKLVESMGSIFSLFYITFFKLGYKFNTY